MACTRVEDGYRIGAHWIGEAVALAYAARELCPHSADGSTTDFVFAAGGFAYGSDQRAAGEASGKGVWLGVDEVVGGGGSFGAAVCFAFAGVGFAREGQD